MLGMVVGQTTGNSREAAVGAVMPAILGLVGGIMVYLLGTTSRRTQVLVALAIIALTSNLVVGIFWGAKSRVVYQAAYQNFQENVVKNPRRLLAREMALEDNRRLIALKRLQNDQELQDIRLLFEQQRSAAAKKQGAKVD